MFYKKPTKIGNPKLPTFPSANCALCDSTTCEQFVAFWMFDLGIPDFAPIFLCKAHRDKSSMLRVRDTYNIKGGILFLNRVKETVETYGIVQQGIDKGYI